MAASTETVAWIAAAGATAGALVGATVGGLVDYALDRLRERRDAKVGARLVRLDLALAARQLKEAEQDGKWWVFFNTRMPGWEKHRVSLTARLEHDDFERVTQAVAELERFGEDMKQAPLDTGASFRTVSPSTGALRTMRSNATAAHNALAKLAGGERLPDGHLLHEGAQ
jgi:hypothetical protein